jgi:hypothetical protein
MDLRLDQCDVEGGSGAHVGRVYVRGERPRSRRAPCRADGRFGSPAYVLYLNRRKRAEPL